MCFYLTFFFNLESLHQVLNMSTDFSTVTDGDYLPPSLPQPVEEKNFYQHRVFINHVDSFHAKYIASVSKNLKKSFRFTI